MENPVVTLAGKDYPVPPLVIRQQREVVPALGRIAEFFKGRESALEITKAMYDDFSTVIYWGAVWPNNKVQSVDFVIDLPLSLAEIFSAINVIRQQTGLFKAAPEGASTGESIPPVKA